MAPHGSKRRSRKRRSPAAAPHAVPSQQRELRAAREPRAREPTSAREQARARTPLGAVGERPPSPFGGLPISEVAIFAGIAGMVVGLIQGGPALIVGVIVCTLGVVEVTAREHFAGYRSHSMLLAAIPAVGLEVGLVAAIGAPRQRALLLLAVVPVYAGTFWFLRKRFQIARQARIARPPAP